MTQVRSGPRLEPTPLAGVLRIHADEPLAFDRANLKGEGARDGLLSVEDARALGIPDVDWRQVTTGVMSGEERFRRVTALVERFAKTPPSTKLLPPRHGEPDLEVSGERARHLKAALTGLRTRIEAARERGRDVFYPVKNERGDWVRDPRAPVGAFAVDPKQHVKVKLSPEEAQWLFGTLTAKTEKVVLMGARSHYMTPELKAQLDARVGELAGELQAALAAGKSTVYISTPISSVDPKINMAIAAGIKAKMLDRAGLEGGLHILNPAEHQGVAGMIGDDYMYMWEQLLQLNLFRAVRFTALEDTMKFFEERGERVPKEYRFTYGDALHSAGCRYEWNIFAQINIDLGAQGLGHLQVPMFHGDRQLSPAEMVTKIPEVNYAVRGEILE